jgi:hypothetical protein
MKVSFFHCLIYSHTVQVEIDRGQIEEPTLDLCASVGTVSFIHNRCEVADRQAGTMNVGGFGVPFSPYSEGLTAMLAEALPHDRMKALDIKVELSKADVYDKTYAMVQPPLSV